MKKNKIETPYGSATFITIESEADFLQAYEEALAAYGEVVGDSSKDSTDTNKDQK